MINETNTKILNAVDIECINKLLKKGKTLEVKIENRQVTILEIQKKKLNNDQIHRN